MPKLQLCSLSSRDSPINLSSILSGEGLYEGKHWRIAGCTFVPPRFGTCFNGLNCLL